MGQYNKAVLTAAGENLIARTLAGEIQLNITKAKTSNYIYPASTDFKSLTDMQGIKQTATDPVTAVYNDTMIQTRVLFSNEEIASTYYIHNIGLYAMDGTQEVLFCIVTAESPDEMPQYNGVASTSYIYNIQNVVQDAAQLNITVNPSGTATIQDVLERVDATGGDISETIIETLDTVVTEFPVPNAGEYSKAFLGKVRKFIQDFNNFKTGIITLGKLVNNGQTTEPGFALDARYGKTLYDLLSTHKSSSDHDSRYYTETEVDSKFTTHKSSGDHDGRYYTETEINNKLAYTAGSATINFTYVSTSSNSHIYWKKWGRIVTVEVYDIDLKPGYSTDDMAIIATGLPAAQNQQITAIIGLTSANISDAIRVRVLVDDSGQLKPWFLGTPTTPIYMSGSFTYISAS